MSGSDAIEFDGWVHTILPPSDDSDRSEGEQACLLAWLRQVYEAEGPLDIDAVGVAHGLHLMAMADEAIAIVLADVHHTAAERPTITIDVPQDVGGPVISYTDDGVLNSRCSIWLSICPGELLVEVAGDIQEHMCEAYGYRVWPVCPDHGFGLHAINLAEEAVWWCRYRRHRVAAVGDLARKVDPGRTS